MNIRLAVGCALVVFFLSVALIIGIGIAQPAPAVTVVHAAPVIPTPVADVSQMRRDFLQGSPVDNVSAPQPQAQDNSSVSQPSQPAQQPPVVQPAPPPQHAYIPPSYTTRAS